MGKPRPEPRPDPLRDALQRALATETDPQVREWLQRLLASDGAAKPGKRQKRRAVTATEFL